MVLLSVRRSGLLPSCRDPGDRAGAGPRLAELALAGESPCRGGREEIDARVAAEVGIRATGVEVAVDAMLDSGEAGRQSRDGPATTIGWVRTAFRAVRDGGQPDPQTVARCLIGLPVFAVRDACVHPWDGEDGDAALELGAP